MSIAVYTIMRDEVTNVAQWAETTGEADYRFVLDTGSTDGTIDELDAHGIEYQSAAITPFRFDDARNASLALLPESIEWCLQVDADETLSWDWKQRFESVCDDRIRRYTYRWENHGLADWGVVMRSNLHARHGFRWRYPAHEVLVPLVPTLEVPLLTVEHHPDETKSRRQYIDLLVQGVMDEPNDHRMAFYYARELKYLGAWNAARDQLQRFLAMTGGWPPERAEAWRLLAEIDDDPERWLWKAVAECPERREPFCDLARLYLRHGDGAAARAMTVLAARRVDEGVYTTSRDCWHEAFDTLCDECAVTA